MRTKIKLSSGRIIEVEGKIIKKRKMFGREECLIEGRLSKPIWVTGKKKVNGV